MNKFEIAIIAMFWPHILGDQSIDNFMLCQEFIHSLHHNKSRKGGIIIKLDLEKAYDSIEWQFIEEILKDAAIPTKIASVIMRMITSGSCRPIWDGEAANNIKPSRGLYQGDLLLPYIFVLCMKRLGHWKWNTIKEGRWKALKEAVSSLLHR